jgi:hypothetical protein
MAGTETADTVTLLVAALKADSTLSGYVTGSWWEGQAQGVLWPFGIVHWQGGVDLTFMSIIRVGHNGLVTCKVVGLDSTMGAVLKPAARRMDFLLQGFSASNADVNLVGKLYREYPIDYYEDDDEGIKIRHLGGVYRFLAQ